MKLENSLKQTQKQIQKLSLNQQYSLKVLEMNDTQMLDTIIAELEVNPVLEANEMIYSMQEQAYGDQTPFELALNYVAKEETLSEVLMQQLHTRRKVQYQSLAEFLIESLDSNGYLSMPMAEIMEITHASNDEIEETIQMIQTFEPYGVCARNLQECILIQLSYLQHPCLKYAIEIVNEYLNELAQNHLPYLAKQLECSLEEINEAVALIRSCNPKPAASYATSSSYIMPDVKVTVENGEIQISLLSDRYQVRISPRYQNQNDDAIKRYLDQYMKSAKLLISSIEKRNVTLLGIIHCIVKHQQGYFLNNEQLVPLTLKDVAEELNVHESTVSRTISNKYMDYQERMIPLKFFFPSRLASGDSSDAVKKRIVELVDAENRKKPYSDAALASILGEEGIEISRRTIAKYREALGIPSTSKRKIYE